MASAEGNDQSNGSNNASLGSSNNEGLEGFITQQITEQRSNRTDGPGENIDADKMNRFMARALSESRRMNQEVEKSQAKLGKLHSELGAERMAAWRQEHSAEVLTPQQCRLVEMTQPKI
ncbi:uncharacterized protein [Littorina saxatilis]